MFKLFRQISFYRLTSSVELTFHFGLSQIQRILPTTTQPLLEGSTTFQLVSTTLPPTDVTPCKNYVPAPNQKDTPGMADWCKKNCSGNNCPPDFCVCSESDQ
jgi:hypothetical protein